MGCMNSKPASSFTSVRVINISGHIEDFEAPVTVSDITGKPPKHILCSSAHLVAFGSNPLRPDDNLEPGMLYFLLPHSIFESESSATDLATLMMRLRSVAKKGGQVAQHGCPKSSGGQGVKDCGGKGSSHGKSPWKPQLDPIYERSFGRSMERETMSGGLSPAR